MDAKDKSANRNPKKIERMFDVLAPRYDFLNSVFSMGLDYFWRKKAASAIRPKIDGAVLDGACGEANLAVEIAKAHKNREIVGVDLSERMLEVGREKTRRAGLSESISLKKGDLANLPFENGSFAAATVAFGVRNVQDRDKALVELRRVLAKGGRLVIMDFSMPEAFWFAPIYRAYFKYFMPFIAGLFGEKETFQYLFQSVDDFPKPDEFIKMIQKAGFENVAATPMTFGTVVIYTAEV